MTAAATRKLGYYSILVFGVTVVGMLVAAASPNQRLWGINWYGYFGWDGRLILALFSLIVLLVAGRIIRQYESRSDKPESTGSYYPIVALLVVVLFAVAFYLFRGRTHFLGDGYQLLTWVQKGVHFKPWEKGAYVVQSWVFGLLGGAKEDALPALQSVSYASGLLFLTAGAAAAVRLYAKVCDRMLFLLGVGTGGYMLLFFGYLESYPLFVFSVGLFCMVGLLRVRDKISRWLILVPLALAGFFHIFAVALLPGAIYAVFRGSRWGDRIASLSGVIKLTIVGMLAAVSAAVFFYFYTASYFFRFTIVPIIPDQHTVDGYWMFSLQHLLDYCNHLFQLLPALLLFGPLFLIPKVREKLRSPDQLFLLLVLVPSLGLTFVINPGLGMARDWDLFSFAGVPLTLLFYTLVLASRDILKGVRLPVTLGLALSLMLLAPRVATQVDPDRGIAVFDRMAALDRANNSSGRYILREYLMNQGRYDEAERRRRRDNVILPEGEWVETARDLIAEGRLEAGSILLRRAIRSNPSHHMAWANLGAVYAQTGQYDSALLFLKIAGARMPFNAGIYTNLGGVYFSRGDFEDAERIWLEAVELDPDDITASRQLLHLYEHQGRAADYRSLLLNLVAENKAPPDILARAADLKIGENDFVTASGWLARALDGGLDTAYVCELQRQHPQLEVINCEE